MIFPIHRGTNEALINVSLMPLTFIHLFVFYFFHHSTNFLGCFFLFLSTCVLFACLLEVFSSPRGLTSLFGVSELRRPGAAYANL